MNSSDSNTWHSKDGRKTPIQDLTSAHLINIVKMLLKWAEAEHIATIANANRHDSIGIQIPAGMPEVYEALPIGTAVYVPGVGEYEKASPNTWSRGDFSNTTWTRGGLSDTNEQMARFGGCVIDGAEGEKGTRIICTNELLNELAGQNYPQWDSLLREVRKRHLTLGLDFDNFLQTLPTEPPAVPGTGFAQAAIASLVIAGLIGLHKQQAKTKTQSAAQPAHA